MTSPSNSRFVFDPKASDNLIIQEKRKELEQMEAEIEDLESRVSIGSMPLFSQLIKFFASDVDAKEVEILGKALTKYGKNLPRLRILRKEMTTIDMARANPQLIELAFSDASSISTEFERMLQTDEPK
jgi:hypothetical protein